MEKIFDFWSTIDKPKWLTDTDYLTVMGSRAYGCALEDSDWDFYGFTTPPVEILFPHLAGDIPDFGMQKKRFNQLQLHGVPSEKYGDVDLTVYNIVKYFDLVMGMNPNMVDSLFVPDDAILHMNGVGKLVRENRHSFLSQKLWQRCKGMAWSHMKRITSRGRLGKRKAIVEKFGYDTKDGSNVVRVIEEAQDFLFKGDADISANADKIRRVRNGEWALDKLKNYFEASLENVEIKLEAGLAVIPEYPDQDAIKALLEWCLEEKYGQLANFGYNTRSLP